MEKHLLVVMMNTQGEELMKMFEFGEKSKSLRYDPCGVSSANQGKTQEQTASHTFLLPPPSIILSYTLFIITLHIIIISPSLHRLDASSHALTHTVRCTYKN